MSVTEMAKQKRGRGEGVKGGAHRFPGDLDMGVTVCVHNRYLPLPQRPHPYWEVHVFILNDPPPIVNSKPRFSKCLKSQPHCSCYAGKGNVLGALWAKHINVLRHFDKCGPLTLS